MSFLQQSSCFIFLIDNRVASQFQDSDAPVRVWFCQVRCNQLQVISYLLSNKRIIKYCFTHFRNRIAAIWRPLYRNLQHSPMFHLDCVTLTSILNWKNAVNHRSVFPLPLTHTHTHTHTQTHTYTHTYTHL